jgi:hypothetical protein
MSDTTIFIVAQKQSEDYYKIWQLENFGDVLPPNDNPLRPVDDDEQYNSDRIDEERIFAQHQDDWYNEQTF